MFNLVDRGKVTIVESIIIYEAADKQIFMKRTAIISPDATEKMTGRLKKLDIKPVKIPRTSLVAKPLSGHPDLQIFLSGKTCFCHRDIDTGFLAGIEGSVEVVICETRLSPEHPGDIPYNIALAGNTALHRLIHTERQIRESLERSGVKFFDVSQPYTKCSVLVAGENEIITSDSSIHKTAPEAGLRSLLISPGHVRLPGYSYGFIGGASGLTEDHVILTGSMDAHPDRERIEEFITGTGKSIYYLSNEELIDLGTVFVV